MAKKSTKKDVLDFVKDLVDGDDDKKTSKKSSQKSTTSSTKKSTKKEVVDDDKKTVKKSTKSTSQTSTKKSTNKDVLDFVKDIVDGDDEKSAKSSTSIPKSKSKRTTYFVFVVFFVLGAVLAVFTFNALCANDTFELVGEKQVVVSLGEEYLDEGVKIVSMGRDISSNAKLTIKLGDQIVDSVDVNQAGTYIITYTVEDLRYGEFYVYRVVTVQGGEPDVNEDVTVQE
ncbi:MAG: DUF5011 domain-containing protein [Clostridia bacterium]|nr:DUF5011 domain-containing protein [Clostridia bacterium]